MIMETLLLIETSTDCCSVALSRGESVLASRSDSSPKVHASRLVPLIEEIFAETGLSMSDVDAVAVSQGPGSYTGLRVGVSTAKGLCFGSSKPLLAIDTLQILVQQGLSHPCHARHIVPFIDARRMEVYTLSGISPVSVILDETSFSDLLSDAPTLFIGTGVTKFQSICQSPNAHFEECYPQASAMAPLALEAYKKKEFKDVAYFEPFYLKEFTPGISKKSIL